MRFHRACVCVFSMEVCGGEGGLLRGTEVDTERYTAGGRKFAWRLEQERCLYERRATPAEQTPDLVPSAIVGQTLWGRSREREREREREEATS